MARYSGKGGVVYLGTAGGAVPSTVATLSAWTIDMSTDKQDVTGFGDTNKIYMTSLPDMVGTLSGFWDDTDDNLYDASRSTGPVSMYLYPTGLATAKVWSGTAWIDMSIECPVSGPITMSANWAAASAWAQA